MVQYAGSSCIRHSAAWGMEDKARLLLMLYQKAMRCMDEAIDLIEAGEMVAKGEKLLRAQDIVLQLCDALDHQSGAGELTANLERLYLYIYRQLVKGNIRLDTEAIREARKHMGRLYVAWEQIADRREVRAGARARW